MTILDSARVLLRAENYSGTGAWLDETGNGHDFQLGTTSGADAADPLYKAYDGTPYIFLPGLSGNSMQLPNLAAYNFTTQDFDFRIRLAADDYTPGSLVVLANKWVTGPTNGYRFEITTGGLLQYVTGNAGTEETLNSSVAVPFSDEDIGWIRYRLVGTTLTYFTSTDTTHDPLSVNWTQLGTTDTITQDPGTGTGAFFIGRLASSDANQFAGDMYRVWFDISGTVELNVVLADSATPFATFTERSSNAATVTITRSATGLRSTVIVRAQFIFTTDDRMETPDDAALDLADGEDGTLIAVAQMWDVSADVFVFGDKSGGFSPTTTGWRVDVHSSLTIRSEISDGTNEAADFAGALADNTVFSAGMRRDDTTPELESFFDGVGSGSPDGTPTDDLSTALVVVIGEIQSAFAEGSLMAWAWWESALTDAEFQEAHDLLIGGTSLVIPPKAHGARLAM